MAWFKRCRHEWQVSKRVPVVDMAGDELYTQVYIYCPKCSKRRKVASWKWNVIDGEQQIQREWEAKQV